MEDEEINAKFKAIEKRLDILENKKSEKKEIVKEDREDFSGLVGGIRLLVKNSFLISPKSVKEIEEELKREGYHYSYKSVDKALRDFNKIHKILGRIKEDKKWKYAIRK